MRENFSLLTALGWANAYRRGFDAWTREFLWTDTRATLCCWVVGHRHPGPGTWCQRCYMVKSEEEV